MKVHLAAGLSGLVFGAGLVIAGMTDTAKVIAFLDVFGRWDPSLAFVMIGAIGVHFLLLRAIRRLPQALSGEPFERPRSAAIDRRLLAGAAVFGVGWGLGGICPGPGFVSAGAGSVFAIVFLAAMAFGTVAVRRWLARSA